MKTLDEVIKGFECCKEVGCGECPYKILFDDDSHVPCDQFEKDDDALQWLKGYKAHIELDKLRDKYSDTSQITCPKCHSEFVILPESNNALTWDELKQMEGKPVWVEALLYKQWAVIAYIGDEYIRFEGANLYAPECRTYMGADNGWKAYRKERS